MNDPRIRIDFWLTGDVFDPEEITETLGIIPTRTRLKKDCSLPQTAATTWKLSTKKEESRAISRPLDQLFEQLRPKIPDINEICRTLDLTASFVAMVEMEAENRPEFWLNPDHISVMAALQAEFNIDLYVYEDLETAFS